MEVPVEMGKKPKDPVPELEDLDPRKSMDPKNPKILNREVHYKGKIIIHQGDVGHRAYYIERGRVEILLKDGAHQLRVAEMGPGDIFGEMALITKEARSASVRAIDECVLTVISLEEVEGKIKRIHDPAIRALINVLAERLRSSTKGQMNQYKSLAEFQDRVTGIVEGVHEGIDAKHRDAFRAEVTPLLDDLQKILDRYQG
jgi:CRP/FNR family cyclic AMP-dependent transcriptional regulator